MQWQKIKRKTIALFLSSLYSLPFCAVCKCNLRIRMRCFFEFVSCCWSCSAGKEEKKRLLVPAPENRRRVGRRRGWMRGGRGREWRPSLSSISEDNVLVAERINNGEHRPAERWRRSLNKKVPSVPRRDRARSLDNYHVRRTPLIVPPFAPTPFMF